MAWIEVHQSLFTHRKTLAVADSLDLPEVYVAAHMISLWTWALDNAENGVLPHSRRIIARAARWGDEPDTFVDALIEAGFLDVRLDESLCLHDWWDYAGRLIEAREKNAERQRHWRERRRNTDVTVTAGAGAVLHNDNVTVTSRARHTATVPNPTQPNRTEPERESTHAPTREGKPTKVPLKWNVTAALFEWARGEGWTGSRGELQRVSDNFVDHHKSKETLSYEWEAEWRKWVRREIRDYTPSQPRASPGGEKRGGRERAGVPKPAVFTERTVTIDLGAARAKRREDAQEADYDDTG